MATPLRKEWGALTSSPNRSVHVLGSLIRAIALRSHFTCGLPKAKSVVENQTEVWIPGCAILGVGLDFSEQLYETRDVFLEYSNEDLASNHAWRALCLDSQSCPPDSDFDGVSHTCLALTKQTTATRLFHTGSCFNQQPVYSFII